MGFVFENLFLGVSRGNVFAARHERRSVFWVGELERFFLALSLECGLNARGIFLIRQDDSICS